MKYDSNYTPRDAYDYDDDDGYPEDAIDAIENIGLDIEKLTAAECTANAAKFKEAGELPAIAFAFDEVAAYLGRLEARAK